jgi:tetratricopeptide (TPR) repeat protein
MWRANVCLRKGSYDQAVAYARKAIDLEPDMPAPWYSLTSAYVELKQYPQAVEALQTLQSRFGVKLSRERMVSNPKFAGFVQSDAFLKWMPQ